MALTLAQMQANHKAKQQQGATLPQSNAMSSAPKYNQSDYTRGWGIGYDKGNVSGGFNQWNDLGAVQNEFNRMNTVTSNREKFGMQNTNEHQSYLDRLEQSLKPQLDAQNNIKNAQDTYNKNLLDYQQRYNQAGKNTDNAVQGWRDDYTNSQAAQDFRNIQNATVQDIASKYGFDFSKEYATRQAEAEAQALRDANANAQRQNESLNKQNLQRIENNIMSANEQLDRSYFQQGLNMGQDQVESGLNAGIAADQALRLQMGRQAAMGDVYRDAGLGRMTEDQRFANEGLRLTEGLGTINQQALANAEKMFQQMQMQGYDILSNDRNFYAAQDQQQWQRSQAEIDREAQQGAQDLAALQWLMQFDQQGLQDTIGNEQWAIQNFQNQMQNSLANQQWNKQFDYNVGRDNVADRQWQTQFDYNAGRDKIGDQQWQQQFDWGKIMDEAGLTGLYQGKNTWDRTQGEFNMGLAEREFAFKKEQAAIDNAYRNAALALRGSGGGGGGGRSRGSGGGGSTAKSAPNTGYNAAYNSFQREQAVQKDRNAGIVKGVVTEHPAVKQQQFMQQVMNNLREPVPQPREFVIGAPPNKQKKKK